MPPDPQDGHKPPHNAKQGASRFGAVVRLEDYGHWQRTPRQKIGVHHFSILVGVNGIAPETPFYDLCVVVSSGLFLQNQNL